MYNFGIRMTEEEKKLLGTFEARVRHLMYLHDDLKHKNAELEQLLSEKEEEIKKMQDDYNQLKADYTNLKQARIISIHDNELRDTKIKLSKLVREVEKCIALLNE